MMNDWLNTTIGEQFTLQRGFDITKKEHKPGTVPVISSSGISGHHNEAKVKGPGVITGRKGTLGTVFYVEEDYWPHDTTLWVKEFNNNHPKFVYYFLKSIDLLHLDVGSANPTLNRNHVHPIEVIWPKPDEQKAITAVLSAFDDKIELNRQMNATLEAMARTLFKSWFINFDPVRRNQEDQEVRLLSTDTSPDQDLKSLTSFDHLFPDRLVKVEGNGRELPEGWQSKPLDEIADYQNGLALQKYPPESDEYLPVVKIRELRQGFVDDNSNQASPNIKESCILYDGDVVFSWSGSLLVVLWCGGKGALNQHLFKVTSEQYPKWFYYYWTKHHLNEFQRIAAGKATTMGHIQRKHLSAAETAVPPTALLKAMTNIMKPIMEQMITNRLESRTLANLRDTLLPRLMSGQLRVPEARLLQKEPIT